MEIFASWAQSCIAAVVGLFLKKNRDIVYTKYVGQEALCDSAVCNMQGRQTAQESLALSRRHVYCTKFITKHSFQTFMWHVVTKQNRHLLHTYSKYKRKFNVIDEKAVLKYWGWRDSSKVKNTGCSSRSPELNSQ